MDQDDAIFDQIDRADLSATAYRTAMRLWRLAAASGGMAHIERAQMIEVCGTETGGTLRNHLSQIAKAGIIEYHAGDMVFVRLLMWDLHAERAEIHAERANDDGELHAECANLHARNDARHAERANSAIYSHARSGRLVGRSLSITEPSKKPTNPPTSQILNCEQQLAFDLLVDAEVGVINRVADELARKLPAQDIYRVVDKWLPDHQADKVGVGALKHRLESLKPSSARLVSLSAGFRDSELFHRHRLPDEMVADPERKQYGYVPEPQQGRRYSV